MLRIAERAFRVVRRVTRRAALRPFRAHGLILLYHRVASPAWDPWNNCVSAECFEQHLAILSRMADIVPLAQLSSLLRAGRRQRPVVAITFDDGYADNLHVALPLLEKYAAPATVFIATSWIGRREPFWWDQLSELLRSMDPVPTPIRISIGDEDFLWQPGPRTADYRRERDRLHIALWSRLLLASEEQRRSSLAQLSSYAGTGADVDPLTRPMTREELSRLAASPLVEIGAHTMSHCSLPDMSPAAQLSELTGSREQCRGLIGTSPSSFAYPFGGVDERTPELVRSAGFARACSSENELVWAGCESMLMPRIQVRNYSARTFATRLRWEWLP